MYDNAHEAAGIQQLCASVALAAGGQLEAVELSEEG
jgi:hypothetical protein